MECTTMFVATILMMASAALAETNYCDITPEHDLCKYHGVGEECGSPFERGVNSTEVKIILDAHNQYRRTVANGEETRGNPGPQPQAADMMELVWDDELAKVAQMWADQCMFKHDCNDCRKVPRFAVGQNLYISWYSLKAMGSDWRAAAKSWYDEVEDFNKDIVSKYEFDSKTGHYTQVVWANSGAIGCGYIHYLQDNWYKKFYVCNYGPAGNYIGQRVYTIGNPCSQCPSGTSCSSNYPGLCA